jgi:hypothetical protein
MERPCCTEFAMTIRPEGQAELVQKWLLRAAPVVIGRHTDFGSDLLGRSEQPGGMVGMADREQHLARHSSAAVATRLTPAPRTTRSASSMRLRAIERRPEAHVGERGVHQHEA